MTYDIFCYKPITRKPSLEEARRVTEAGSEFPPLKRVLDPEVKWKIAAALAKFDKRLVPFQLDRTKLVNMSFSLEEKAKVQGIALDYHGPRMSIELDISDERVWISIPYWFEGPDADELFAVVANYLRVIRRTAGFFVYDPQAQVAFDPLRIAFGKQKVDTAPEIYGDTMKRLPDIMSRIAKEKQRQKGENESS